MDSIGCGFRTLRFVWGFETKGDLADEICLLGLKAGFLEVFLSCGEKDNNIETRRFQALLRHITTKFQSLDLATRRCLAGINWNLFVSMNVDDLVSSVQQSLGLLNPHVHEVYTILSKSSRSTLHGDSQATMKNLSYLQKYIEDLLVCNAELVAPVKEELEAAQKGMRFLRDFLCFTGKRCSKLGKLKDLIIHAEFLAEKMSCLLYMCCVNEKMNDWMVNEMKMHLSSELKNFSPAQPDVRQIYIKALKVSKSAQGNSVFVNEFDRGFLNSLRYNILQLPDTKLSFTASSKDQILSLHEDLKFLTIFFAMHESSEANEARFIEADQISNYFVELINVAIVDMGCLIYSLHNSKENTYEVKELKIAVFDLQDTIRAAKEDARKAFDKYFPEKHLKIKFRRTDAGGILPSQMISKMKHSLTSLFFTHSALSWPVYMVFEMELFSLIKAFRILTAKQHVEHEELEIPMMHFNEIRNEIETFISTLSQGLCTFWSMHLWLFVLIEGIKMTKMDFEYLQNRVIHDTLVSKVTTKTKVEVNKTAIGYSLISEGEQIINGSKSSHIFSINAGIRGMEDQMRRLETNLDEMKMLLSSDLQKFSPTQPDVKEIYIEAQKATKSAKGNSNFVVLDEFLSGFLDSLRDDQMELSENYLSLIASSKEQILSLQEELKFLITFFTMDRSLEGHSNHDQISSSLFKHINDVIIDLGSFIYLLNNDESHEMMARELNKKVSDLVANFMVAKADIKKIYELYVPRPLPSDFPRTNGQGYIDYLFQNLNELLNTNLDLVAALKFHIEIVQKELLSLREDFGKIAGQPNKCDELQSQWNRFLDTAYQVEFIVDSFIIGGDPIYHHKLGLFNVIEEIKTIKMELKVIKIKMTDETLVPKSSCFSIGDSVDSNFQKNNTILTSKERLTLEKSTTKIVIFGEKAEEIRLRLTNGSQKLNIISIVGMPGIGKTTLADSLFQHSSIVYHFHVRARCSVSQVYNKRRLLLEILQEVFAQSKQYTDDVDQILYQSLKGRKYLILLDDLWNIQPWEDIKASFPDDENGSRIIFTSRFEDISTQAGLESINFHLSPLSKEKSWEMLHAKLFGNKSCPPELVSVVERIAANCRGLPLTIDLVAGDLRMKERKEWKKVAKSLMTILFEDPQGRCWKILELSYQNLPDDLKPCFLYFAIFPEDENVPTRDLILLWIAEGFVKLEKDETRSLEDVAMDILNNLIRRSLVIVSRRGPLGGVDASRIHDLLHEFARAKAQEESFMLKIDGKALSSVGVRHHWREQYRLCICSNYWRQFPESISSIPRTRALILSNNIHRDVYPNFNTYKLLRVLYIPGVYDCPEIFTLIHLRLLVISIFENSHAQNMISNIHKLRNLESFIMNDQEFTMEVGTLLLDEICKMVKLRHFCVAGYICIRYLREEIWQKSSFANLRTLYNLKLNYDEDHEKILKLMPNLMELKVLLCNLDEDCYPFLKLDFLKKLESLELSGGYFDPLYGYKIISFPPHLRRLCLSGLRMPWTEISKIGNLEYLEVLELKFRVFTGPIWDMTEGQFPKLKYLSLSDLDIEEWNASEDHLSYLEQLHVELCTELKDLPPCLAEIATLRAMKVFCCSQDVENSAKRIKEEQEQMGNEQICINEKF